MAFQYKKNDVRGKPVLKFVGGEWKCFYDHFSTSELVYLAEDWCEMMKSPLKRHLNKYSKLF